MDDLNRSPVSGFLLVHWRNGERLGTLKVWCTNAEICFRLDTLNLNAASSDSWTIDQREGVLHGSNDN